MIYCQPLRPRMTAMKALHAATITVVSLLFFSCGKDSSSVVKDWESEDWRVEATFGETGPIKSHSHLKSEKAKAVEVHWIINGKRKAKRYPQESKLYLALHFYKDDGDVFAVLMSRHR